MINKSYKKTKCYMELENEYQNSLDLFIEFYGDVLNKGCPIGKILYTSHDFNKHCCNLYKIISDIFFANNMPITPKELYILDLAVLFHDISMAANINWDRKKHSKESAEYIRKEFNKTGTVLHNEREKTLTVNDLNALQYIITAHSDVKDGSVNENENGVRNPNLSSNMPGDINGKLLAAILRLADELDVTSDRLGKQDFVEQLDENDEKQNESKKHWKNLNYFSAVKNDMENSTKLLLVCDDNYITDHLDDVSNIISDIKAVVKKITQELSELNREVFHKRENAKLNFHIKDIEVKTKVKEVENELNNPLLINNTNNISLDPERSTDNRSTEKKTTKSPVIISNNLSANLKKYIEVKKLLKCGHYLLNDTFCSRDWIDTNDIIETSEICDKCIGEFMNHCRTNFEFYTDCIIIGLDLEGAILASLLAMNLGISFQYVIPAKSENTNSEHDKIKNLPVDKKIIIVTDAVCTYETIKSVVEKYNLTSRLVAIYTLLYRHPQLREATDKDLFDKTYCLNSDFPMEVSKKSKCKYYNSGTCIALNKG